MWMSSNNKTKHHYHSLMLTQQQEEQQHQPVLPSFHAFCKTIEDQTPPPTPAPTSIIHDNIDHLHGNNKNTKNHIRTSSMPTRLPSQQKEHQQKQRLSLEVLLDAIELDQSMYDAYQHEWSKTNTIRGSHVHDHHQQQKRQCNAATAAIVASRRKRSKSAPGIPRWRTPYSAPKCRNVSVQQIAESIVQKHIEYARKK